MANTKLQAGIINPKGYADGSTVSPDPTQPPQLQYIDPASTQVQYNAPQQMSLDDAHKALQTLYGPGQDYSDTLAQIQALQGQIHPQTWGSHLMDFGARLMGGGNLGTAASGAMEDDRNIGQQNLTNLMALMKAKQAIQAQQQEREDQIAGKSENYAQQQNQDAINASKNQYDVDRNNTNAKVSALEHNNTITQNQQDLDQKRLQELGNEQEVATLQQQAQAAADKETDPQKKAALQAQANSYGQQLKQVQAIQQGDLERKTAEQIKLQNNQNANAVKLEQMREANTRALMGGNIDDSNVDWVNNRTAALAKARAEYDFARGVMSPPPGRQNPQANEQYKYYTMAYANMLKNNGQNGADIAGNHAVFQGNTAGIRSIATQQAQAGASLDAIKQQQPIIMGYAQSIKNTTGKPVIDEKLLDAQIANGNPNAIALRNLSNTFAFEYARLNAGKGSSDTLRKDAQDMFSKALNTGDWNEVFKVTDAEGETRMKGYSNQINSMKSGITGRTAEPQQTFSIANGNGAQLDPATAQKYMQAAGGDKNKARELAKKDNWKL